MKKLKISEMERIEGGDFWGKESTCVVSHYETTPYGTTQTVYWRCEHTWRFWIDFGKGCYYADGCATEP